MSRRPRGAVLLWLAGLAVCLYLLTQARFTADLSAFLPQTPSAEQRLLVEQLRDGPVSRLLLIGIRGGEAIERAAASRTLASRLQHAPEFVAVANGEAASAEADQQWLFEQRYLLSPAVDAERFSVAGLHRAIQASIERLSSPAGLLLKQLLPRDPTGETLALLDALAARGQPASREGVWSTRDGEQALLLATTRAAGADTDGQAAAVERVRTAFAPLAHGALQLELSGPGVFAVQARATIKSEVERLSLLASALIAALLLYAYRSPRLLLLGLLPMVSGALAGIAAVAAGFGVVHGITLGFGITLIGEAVDYAIYLFVQSARSTSLAGFWPTVRLGVLTSVCGFAALLPAQFPGLAQLGAFSLVGLLTAALVTRHVLPALLPATLQVRDLSPLGRRLAAALPALRRLRPLLLLLIALAAGLLYSRQSTLWQHELAALSPVSAADQALDARLRAALGAPEVRYLVVARAASADAALHAAERLAPTLDALQAQGLIGGYDSAARYLPSLATQQARRAALPDAATLRERLQAALAGLPLRAERLDGFLADVEASRRAPPLNRADLADTSFALAVDALLQQRADGWQALLPLHAPQADGRLPDVAYLRAAITASGVDGARFIDLKHESDALYAGYVDEAIHLTLAGCAAIAVLLLIALRSPRAWLQVWLPLAGATLLVGAGLALAGERLTLLHLIGLLLIVAVGSNYALFFARAQTPDATTLASLLLANLTTMLGFGLLAFSSVPVLHAIGVVVGPGAPLALLLAAVLSSPATEAEPAA